MAQNMYRIIKKLAWLGCGVAGILLISYLCCPKPELITFTSYSKAFFDRNGKLLRIMLAEDDRYRLFEPLDNVSDFLINATILYEDKHYFQHHGVDFTALARAFWTTYISGQRKIGASTITMQVARLRWQIKSGKPTGKIHQMLRALQLTRHYSKNDILEAYFNLASYGRNIEGAGAASLIYFNKKVNELSLPEAMTLCVIPQNPNKRVPTNEQGRKNLRIARNNLIQRWLETYPSDKSKAKYFDLPLSVRSLQHLPYTAPHFTNYLDNELSRWNSGCFTTSLDHTRQLQIEKITTDYISSKSSMGINNAAALLLNYKTMEIEAMVGSADFSNSKISGQVNGVLAKRSPGSTLKPFVYGLAIDEGLIHPMTLMKDSPRKYGGFTPENYDKQFLGPILAKDALIQSRNVPAVDLQAQLRDKSFYTFLNEAGITGLKDEAHYGLALALGGGEISMLELAQLYAMLPNSGKYQKTASILNKKDTSAAMTPLLSPEACFLILDMLKDNPAPDHIDLDAASFENNDIPWKTGTSWAFRDAWAIGISGDYVVAVWVGNFDGSGNHAFIGRTAAGPLLFSIFDAIASGPGWSVDKDVYSADLNVKQIDMCKNTGDLPGKYCPGTVKAWFIPGVSPIKTSDIYRAVPIVKKTGLRACWDEPKETVLKVYEFWPSDFLNIFRQAGISLKTPPPYASDCSLNQKSTGGRHPVIFSPQPTMGYVLRSNSESGNEVPLSAVVDPDAEKLFWFVNDSFVGTVNAGTPFFWKAVSGRHTVRVVDDSGRSDSLGFIVSNID